MTRPLFCYGTLCSSERIRQLLGRVPQHAVAALADYRAFLVHGEWYPGLRQEPGYLQLGILYYHLTPADWKALDDYEGPEYEKVLCPVIRLSDQTETTAWCYFFTPAQRLSREPWQHDQVFGDILKHSWGDS